MWEAAVITSAIALAFSGIGALIKSNNQTALNKQSNEYMQKRIEAMEKRLDEHEHEVVQEMKEIRTLMHNIDIKMAQIIKFS